MRVLYYNWVDYLDTERRGGGVTIYQRNLMNGWKNHSDIEATFISSGVANRFFDRKPYWRQVKDPKNADHENRYEIVNSGVLAPSHHDFGNWTQVSCKATVDAFRDFIIKTGPFDVIHFNNLEGLPAEVLNLSKEFTETRFIVTLHNYYPVCPQVNLWQNETRACTDFDNGRSCINCVPHRVDRKLIRLAEALAFNLKEIGIRPGSTAFSFTFTIAKSLGKKLGFVLGQLRRRKGKNTPQGQNTKIHAAEAFRQRRKDMIALINKNCDLALCVSQRVHDIYRAYGVNPALLETEYIATAHADVFRHTQPRGKLPRADGSLTIGYLGYMRRDKGFEFLTHALAALPSDLAQRVTLVAGAARGTAEMMKKLARLTRHLHRVVHIDGYVPDQLDGLLEDVDLGIIPVMWEDNLPQVAIEMHARHIPLLTSDLGGAQELSGTGDLVFKAGDIDSFVDRIRFVMGGKLDTENYWKTAIAPVSIEDHLSRLLDLYRAR